METKNLLNKKITQWLLLVAMLVGCSANAWADKYCISVYKNDGSDAKNFYFEGSSGELSCEVSIVNYTGKTSDYKYWVGKNDKWDSEKSAEYNLSSKNKMDSDYMSSCSSGHFTVKIYTDSGDKNYYPHSMSCIEPPVTITYQIKGSWDGWQLHNISESDFSTDLNTGDYDFVIMPSSGSDYKNKSFTRANNIQQLEQNGGNAWVQADVVGNYTFSWDADNKTLSVTYPEPSYYVAGEPDSYLNGKTWDPSASENKMTSDGAGNYYITYGPGSKDGYVNFAITDGSWENTWRYAAYNKSGSQENGISVSECGNDKNVCVSFTADIKSLAINFDANKGEITLSSVLACETPTALNFKMSDATQTYTGSELHPTITPDDGMGKMTVKYGGTAGTGKTNAGTYAITVDVAAGTTYCAATGISLGNFVINRASRTISITNSATTFCQSETPTVTSSVSAGGTDGTITYTKTGGTATATVDSSTGVITCTAPGTVIVKASISAGTNYEVAESETKTFTFTANPTAYAVSGTESICTGNSTDITLAGSQTGYTYKLYKGGSATSTTKTGTGSALNFSVSEAGTYTVKGYVTGTESCIADMNGIATITIKNAVVTTQPELSNIHPYEVVTLTATNKENVTWTITKTPDNVIIGKNAYFTEGDTGKTVKFKGALGDGYRITATADGCDTEINFNITPDSEVCK